MTQTTLSNDQIVTDLVESLLTYFIGTRETTAAERDALRVNIEKYIDREHLCLILGPAEVPKRAEVTTVTVQLDPVAENHPEMYLLAAKLHASLPATFGVDEIRLVMKDVSGYIRHESLSSETWTYRTEPLVN